jgi:hypothetical protein
MSAQLLKAPTSTSVRLINFTRARIVPGIVPKTWILIVEGTKPCLNMTVALSPLIYVRQPEYWGIEVIGTVPGFCLPAVSPYTVSLPLNGIIGTKGIEVIGASKRKKIDVPGASGPVVSPKSKKSKKRTTKK